MDEHRDELLVSAILLFCLGCYLIISFFRPIEPPPEVMFPFVRWRVDNFDYIVSERWKEGLLGLVLFFSSFGIFARLRQDQFLDKPFAKRRKPEDPYAEKIRRDAIFHRAFLLGVVGIVVGSILYYYFTA